MLIRWKQGISSGGASCTMTLEGPTDCVYTGDFENAECESSMY